METNELLLYFLGCSSLFLIWGTALLVSQSVPVQRFLQFGSAILFLLSLILCFVGIYYGNVGHQQIEPLLRGWVLKKGDPLSLVLAFRSNRDLFLTAAGVHILFALLFWISGSVSWLPYCLFLLGASNLMAISDSTWTTLLAMGLVLFGCLNTAYVKGWGDWLVGERLAGFSVISLSFTCLRVLGSDWDFHSKPIPSSLGFGSGLLIFSVMVGMLLWCGAVRFKPVANYTKSSNPKDFLWMEVWPSAFGLIAIYQHKNLFLAAQSIQGIILFCLTIAGLNLFRAFFFTSQFDRLGAMIGSGAAIGAAILTLNSASSAVLAIYSSYLGPILFCLLFWNEEEAASRNKSKLIPTAFLIIIGLTQLVPGFGTLFDFWALGIDSSKDNGFIQALGIVVFIFYLANLVNFLSNKVRSLHEFSGKGLPLAVGILISIIGLPIIWTGEISNTFQIFGFKNIVAPLLGSAGSSELEVNVLKNIEWVIGILTGVSALGIGTGLWFSKSLDKSRIENLKANKVVSWIVEKNWGMFTAVELTGGILLKFGDKIRALSETESWTVYLVNRPQKGYNFLAEKFNSFEILLTGFLETRLKKFFVPAVLGTRLLSSGKVQWYLVFGLIASAGVLIRFMMDLMKE